MTNYKVQILLFLTILVCSCQQPQNADTAKKVQPAEKKVPDTQLQKMRKSANEKYKEAKVALEKYEAPTPQLDPNIPCNTYYLADIKKRGKISKDDFENLFRLNTKECDNNVEFQQFYNEVLFSSIDKNPTLFYQSFTNPNFRRYRPMIQEELTNPINDGINPEKILSKVSREATVNLKLRSLDDNYTRLFKIVTN